MRRSFVALTKLTLPTVRTFTEGEAKTKEWRMFFKNDKDVTVSAWHDFPLRPKEGEQDVFTFVCEISRGTRAKLELLKEEKFNPIGQDIFKKEPGKPLRYFTYGDMPFNYGFIPRTWENPDMVDADTKCVGDGDPVDVVQLSSTPMKAGECQEVRVLGVLGLIDQGETDWKIFVEPLNSEFGHLNKVPTELKDKIVDWFRNYKTTDGKKQNEFAFNGEIKGAEDALKIIHECSEQYKELLAGGAGNSHGYWLPPKH